VIAARCLCEAVRFEIDGAFGPVVYCHCSQCRRASGTAFAANAGVAADAVRWIAGRELLAEFESSPGAFRVFCSRCGSPLFSRTDADPSAIRVRLGALDGDLERRALAHVWTSAKAPWFEIADDLPRFAGAPPARLVYHVTTLPALRRDCRDGAYAPPSLASEGFIHCTATPATVLAVARDYFGAATEPLVLVAIDAARLAAELRFEAAKPIAGGGTAHLATGEAFPHLYGPLNLDAVAGVAALERDGDAFAWPEPFRRIEAWLA
jgi:uncharacterized protein (DUF952 family)